LDISLRNHPAELTRLAELLDEFARENGLPVRTSRAIALSLHEHVTNVMTHGFGDRRSHELSVHLRLQGGAVEAEVLDDGPSFNPLERPPVDTRVPLDDKPLGGLGVHLIRKLTDELEYRRENDRNILVMRKRFL
jgi:serine/threonine-protein kinase RsbW